MPIQRANQSSGPNLTPPPWLLKTVNGTALALRCHSHGRPDAYPSSAAFENINGALQADAGERKNAMKQAQAIFAFKLKNDQGQIGSWHIDLKDSGSVGKGEAPEGKQADGGLSRQR